MGNPRVLRRLPRVRKPRASAKKADAAAMQQAVRDFLVAAGLDLTDPNLAETPQRVTEAWLTDFLDGYRKSPRQTLGETYPAPPGNGRELVVVTGLRFHSMCPHHLLPFTGVAHVAYLPTDRVVGFGKLGSLLDLFAHRLILQEDLARQVARALMEGLGAAGAACVLKAEHACMRIRGGVQAEAVSHADAYEGLLQTDLELRRELWARL